MMGIDPLYIVLAIAFLAVGVIVYVRAQREQKSKRAVVTAKALRMPDPEPKPEPIVTVKLDTPPAAPAFDPDEIKSKAIRLAELKSMRESGQISQVDYDTAKIKILFER